MCHGVDLFDGLIQGIIGQHRKHRTEDFLLHYCIPEGYIIHNSRSDLKSSRIVVTAADYLAGINQIADTSKVLFINNFPIILIIQRCGTKLFPDLFLDLSDQFILDFSVAVNIIRCYTGLTTVEIFSKYNSSGCKFQVGTFLYNAGAFTAQLQGNRGQMYRCFCHYFPANMLASCKENIVKMFIEKSVIFRTSAVYHSHILGIKTFGDNGFNHPAGVRRVGTWFQYNCISGCNRIDQRINGEQERIIPWTHNQDHTIRRWLLIASGSELGKGSQYCFFFCIGRCMADHVAEF